MLDVLCKVGLQNANRSHESADNVGFLKFLLLLLDNTHITFFFKLEGPTFTPNQIEVNGMATSKLIRKDRV